MGDTMAKSPKVKKQYLRELGSDQTYDKWLHNPKKHHFGPAGQDGIPESAQANPDTLTEDQSYYAIDEATQEVQARVRKMVDMAKQVLTVRQYNAFVLVTLKGLSTVAAARALEVNHQRISQLIAIAHKKLQRVYEERT